MATAMIDRKNAAKGSQGKAVNESVDRYKKAQKTATLLKQASDPTRLQILQILGQGQWHVGALSEEFRMSQPAVCHHLALLRHGGLIIPRRQGKNNFYELTEAGSRLVQLVQGLIG
jgi:DNA-binding transcriptional ArsR family regulator